MPDRAEIETDREILYDIQLKGRPPESLRSRFPLLTVSTTGAQTALRRQVKGPAQLDALLQKLCSVGLVLTELHRLPPEAGDRSPGRGGSLASAEPNRTHVDGAIYEVRVQGELGATLLRYLRWPHYIVPEQTQVRLSAAPVNLQRFLQACTDCGAGIERVRRVGVASAPSGPVRTGAATEMLGA